MTIVVDASVAAKWFAEEEHTDRAEALLEDYEQLRAPDLLLPEIANIAWKKAIRGEVTRAQAQLMTATVRHYIPNLQPVERLIEQALDIALRLNHPVYDCLYIACAKACDGIVVTADKRLCAAVESTDMAASVRHLADAV